MVSRIRSGSARCNGASQESICLTT